MTDKEMMAQRLRDARIGKGYESAREAALAFGWTVSTYTSHENGTRAFGVKEAKQYGRTFRVNPGWLLALDKVRAADVELISSEGQSVERLVVRTAVAAGMWREQIQWPADEWYEVEVGPNPYPGAERFAVRMEGYSMDRVIPPGSTLECVRIAFSTIEPRPGDLVIAERTKHDLTEMTCKRLDQVGEEYVLRCESTRPEFADSVIRVGRPDAEAITDDETRIVGIVISAQQRHLVSRR